MRAQDTDIIDENTYRRLQSAVESRAKMVDALVKGSKRRTYPKRYVWQFKFSVDRGLPQQDTQTVNIARDALFFRARRMTQSVLLTGDVVGSTGSNLLTLPTDASILDVFQHNWSLRDTHTDRLWTNVPMPSIFISNSVVGETLFPRPVLLPPGTAVEMTVSPTLLARRYVYRDAIGTEIPVVINIKEYTLLVSLLGDEEVAQ